MDCKILKGEYTKESFVNYHSDNSFAKYAKIDGLGIKYISKLGMDWMKIVQWDPKMEWLPLNHQDPGWIFNSWDFETGDTHFEYIDLDLDIVKTFGGGYGIEVQKNLRNIFRIDKIIASSKGDLTGLAESLSKKVKSLTYEDLELIAWKKGISEYQAKKDEREHIEQVKVALSLGHKFVKWHLYNNCPIGRRKRFSFTANFYIKLSGICEDG